MEIPLVHEPSWRWSRSPNHVSTTRHTVRSYGSFFGSAAHVPVSLACMFMYISASAPSRHLLGTTNGLGQLTASGVRAFAPTAASSLFALSREIYAHGGRAGTLGEYLVYAVLVVITVIAVFWSMKLPRGI